MSGRTKREGLAVRPERPGDQRDIRKVNLDAFKTPAEADLVDGLREKASPIVSLVAEIDGKVVGHILFSPVIFEAQPDLEAMGLAPMAVLPSHQHSGIGSTLVRAGLDTCRASGCKAVVVLGHPEYYPRFGFRPSISFSIVSEYEVPDEAFMAIELEARALDSVTGVVRYHPAFADI